MGVRGPKSAAQYDVPALNIQVVERPDAPLHLTDEQIAVWRSVVNDLPADWFPPHTHELLTMYCRHVVEHRHAATLIHNLKSQPDGFDVGEYDQLLKIQEREGRAASSLATRLRLTQQSTIGPFKTKPKQAKKLWEG